jgi:hypothetical protein
MRMPHALAADDPRLLKRQLNMVATMMAEAGRFFIVFLSFQCLLAGWRDTFMQSMPPLRCDSNHGSNVQALRAGTSKSGRSNFCTTQVDALVRPAVVEVFADRLCEQSHSTLRV